MVLQHENTIKDLSPMLINICEYFDYMFEGSETSNVWRTMKIKTGPKKEKV